MALSASLNGAIKNILIAGPLKGVPTMDSDLPAACPKLKRLDGEFLCSLQWHSINVNLYYTCLIAYGAGVAVVIIILMLFNHPADNTLR